MSKRREQDPPAKLAGITDNLYKEATFLPTIGEINKKGFRLIRNEAFMDPSEDDLPPLTEVERRQVKALENLNIAQYRDVLEAIEEVEFPF